MLSGSIEAIRSWHPGDPDIEEMEQWRRAHPGYLENLFKSFRPKHNIHIPPGTVMIFGTSSDIEAGDLNTLFNPVPWKTT